LQADPQQLVASLLAGIFSAFADAVHESAHVAQHSSPLQHCLSLSQQLASALQQLAPGLQHSEPGLQHSAFSMQQVRSHIDAAAIFWWSLSDEAWIVLDAKLYPVTARKRVRTRTLTLFICVSPIKCGSPGNRQESAGVTVANHFLDQEHTA